MVRSFRLTATVIIAACLTWPFRSYAQEGLRFPPAERPVASIISSAYADEKERDKKGEAKRVMDRLDIKPGMRVADIGAGDGYYAVRLARLLGPSGTVYAQDVDAKFLNRLE
ncbi:SAM-dependent methyltransferase, partial [bacterium]